MQCKLNKIELNSKIIEPKIITTMIYPASNPNPFHYLILNPIFESKGVNITKLG